MKFKYKKIILMITMCTMCIGMVTISLTSPSKNNAAKKEQEQTDANKFVVMNTGAKILKEAGVDEKKSKIKKDATTEVNELIMNYLNGMLTCDLQALSKIVTNVDNIDVEEMQAKRSLIEQYQNVECLIMDGYTKGEYLAYVYSELKFTGIDTAAPGLNRLYIVTDKDGNLKIELSLIKQEVQEFIAKADECENVKKIIDTVNYKLEEAINNDPKFRAFYAKLNGGSDEVDKEVMSDDTENVQIEGLTDQQTEGMSENTTEQQAEGESENTTEQQAEGESENTTEQQSETASEIQSE
jgi:hypothetical protein